MINSARWRRQAGLLLGLGLGLAPATAFATMTTTQVNTTPVAPLGAADPLQILRDQIRDLEGQLVKLNGESGTLQNGSNDFSSQQNREALDLQIQQTRDNLVRLKSELSGKAIMAKFEPHTPTLIDRVIANLSRPKGDFENDFRLELSSCIGVPPTFQHSLDEPTKKIADLETGIQPLYANLRRATDLVRTHFKKLRGTADPDASPTPGSALALEETRVKKVFEDALKAVADKQQAIHDAIQKRDGAVQVLANTVNAAFADKPALSVPKCVPHPNRSPLANSDAEQAIETLMSRDPQPYAAVDFDRSFYFIKATEVFGTSPDPLSGSSAAGAAKIQ